MLYLTEGDLTAPCWTLISKGHRSGNCFFSSWEGVNNMLLLKSFSHSVFTHRLLSFVPGLQISQWFRAWLCPIFSLPAVWPASPFCSTLPLLNHWLLKRWGFLRRLVRNETRLSRTWHQQQKCSLYLLGRVALEDKNFTSFTVTFL